MLEGEAFLDAVEGRLIAGFEAVKDEAKAGLFHEAVEIFVARVEAHITAEDDFFVVTAFDHEITKAAQPVAGAHGASVVEDFFHGVVINDVFDFGEEAFGGEGAVSARRVERVIPDAEGALIPPAIAATIHVGAGGVLVVPVFVGVEFPAGEVAVDERELVKVVSKLRGSCGDEGAAA